MSDVNIAEDLLLVDNVQQVTITLKRSSDVEVVIEHANGGALNKDLDSSFNTESNLYDWTIPDVELNANGDGYEIRSQDELFDGTHRYTVVTSTNQACGGKWNLTTNRVK